MGSNLSDSQTCVLVPLLKRCWSGLLQADCPKDLSADSLFENWPQGTDCERQGEWPQQGGKARPWILFKWQPISISTGGAGGKELACQRRKHNRYGLSPWVGKIPGRRKWQPTPVFLLGESHGQRSLVGYSPWGRKELDTTEATEHAHTFQYLLRDPVGVFESLYRIHLRMSHPGVRSGGSIFPWAPVSQWTRVALESSTAWFPDCTCQIEGQMVLTGILCSHSSITLGPELGVHGTGSKRGAVRLYLHKASKSLCRMGTSGSFWSKWWNWGDMSGAQMLWDTLTS